MPSSSNEPLLQDEFSIAPLALEDVVNDSNGMKELEDNFSRKMSIINTAISALNISSQPTPVKLTRRGSILTSANPEMLLTLNKMFSPDKCCPANFTRSKTPLGSHRRGSTSNITLDVPLTTITATPDKPKEKKTSRSKLLMRLLEPKSEEAAKELSPKRGTSFFGSSLRPPGMPSMSFLDQIKNGMKSKNKSSDTSSDASLPIPPISFLDQIKNGMKTSSQKSSSSFINQIKGFGSKASFNSEEEKQSDKENSNSFKENEIKGIDY